MDVIAVKDLRKSYGGNPAVDGISFSVPEGSFFALLGPNGAGKSTTISILCSIIPCDSGSAEIFGRDAMDPSARRDIGVVFQDPMMDNSSPSGRTSPSAEACTGYRAALSMRRSARL